MARGTNPACRPPTLTKATLRLTPTPRRGAHTHLAPPDPTRPPLKLSHAHNPHEPSFFISRAQFAQTAQTVPQTLPPSNPPHPTPPQTSPPKLFRCHGRANDSPSPKGQCRRGGGESTTQQLPQNMAGASTTPCLHLPTAAPRAPDVGCASKKVSYASESRATSSPPEVTRCGGRGTTTAVVSPRRRTKSSTSHRPYLRPHLLQSRQHQSHATPQSSVQ